jgi:flagellar hook-associated protein 3 FlgL
MIDLSSQMIYRIGNLNAESERISYQMSTGKVLQNGSDDSVLFARYIDIETKLRDQEGIQNQIEKTIAQNNISDDNIDEVKTTIDNIKQDILKALNAGMTRPDREAVATNLSGMRDNLLRIAQTTVDGEYIYAGSNTTINPYEKDEDFIINGRIDYQGNGHLRQVAIGSNQYRDRGITAMDVLMYNTDTTAVDDRISFTDREMVVDQHGYTWKFLEQSDANYINDSTTTSIDVNQYDVIYDNVTGAYYRAKADFQNVDLDTENFSNATNWEQFNPNEQIFRMNQDGSVGYDYLNVTNDSNDPVTYTSETLAAANASTTPQRLSDGVYTGLKLETKHNFFDDLNIVINALQGYSTKLEDGATYGEKETIIDDEAVRSILSGFTTNSDDQYNATNIGHSELGGRNRVFEVYNESITAKITHYNILIQETNGADLSKLAMESKSLEMTYTALFSTVAKMNEMSLVNFIR